MNRTGLIGRIGRALTVVTAGPRLVEPAPSRYRALTAVGSGRGGSQALLLDVESGRPT